MAGVTERGILSLCNNTQAELRSKLQTPAACSRPFDKISLRGSFHAAIHESAFSASENRIARPLDLPGAQEATQSQSIHWVYHGVVTTGVAGPGRASGDLGGCLELRCGKERSGLASSDKSVQLAVLLRG